MLHSNGIDITHVAAFFAQQVGAVHGQPGAVMHRTLQGVEHEHLRIDTRQAACHGLLQCGLQQGRA